MQHNLCSVSFGLLQIFICFLTTQSNSSSVSKCLLWVQVLLVIFHTLSILFKSGLYGGKKSNCIFLLFFASQGCINVAWWYLALSRMRIIFFPLFFLFTIFFKKSKKVSALNIPASIQTSSPVLDDTAPNRDMLFLVGACSRMGSFSSGGIHIRHRVPCCWKWHSSSNQISFPFLWQTFRSFFKSLL